MSWKISIYEEPGVLLMIKAAQDSGNGETVLSPVEQAEIELKGGLEQERSVLAVVESSEDPSAALIVPQKEAIELEFSELTEKVQTMLGEQKIFETVFLVDSALRGAHGEDPDVIMLAASVFELVRFYTLAAPLLEKVLPKFDGLREAAVKIRLARAWRRSGTRSDVSELLKEGMTCEDLPPVMRVEALLLLAMCQPQNEALETLDELLDAGEEHLGDHRLVAEALELHADLLSDTEAESEKAQKFYLAAGKMLLRLQDPYFFSLNERLVVHHLKHREFPTALALSQEMFDLLQQTGGPVMAGIPFLVFASWVHEQLGDQEKSLQGRETALAINAEEVARVEANLRNALATRVSS